MTQAQLPNTTSSIASQDSKSQLAHYLAFQLLANGGTGINHAFVVDAMKTAMALATAFPFDTQEIVEIKPNHYNEEVSRFTLLEAVLQLTNIHWHAGKVVAWPKDTEGFSKPEHILTSEGGVAHVDTEFVAAALTAAGCNPWDGFDISSGGLPKAVQQAISFGQAGLIDRFMECPGAPSAQWVGQAPAFPTNPEGASVFELVAQKPHTSGVLEVLLRRGARLESEDRVVRVLSEITPAAGEALARHGMISISSQARKTIEAAWKAHQANNRMASDSIEALQHSLWGSVSETMSQGALDIGKHLAVEWGKRPNGSASQAYDFLSDEGADSLVRRAMVPRGPMSGQWSVLAAAVASRIRQGDKDGALGWSTSAMLDRKFNDDQKRWIAADCAREPHESSLKNALGFDWRPGISIDGVVALGLFGQRGSTTDPKRLRELAKDVADFSLAAGIADPIEWAVAQGPAAAEFTKAVLKSPTVNIANTLVATWNTALAAHPRMASLIPEEDKAELMLLFLAKFKSIDGWSSWTTARPSFEGVAKCFFPGLTAWTFETEEKLSAGQLKAALVWHLAVLDKANEEKLEGLQCRADQLGLAHMEIISQWIEATSRQEKAPLLSRLQQMQLHRTVPEASGSRRGPRL